jgi:hypothetical protein
MLLPSAPRPLELLCERRGALGSALDPATRAWILHLFRCLLLLISERAAGAGGVPPSQNAYSSPNLTVCSNRERIPRHFLLHYDCSSVRAG